MDILLIVGIVVFFLSIIVSRWLMEKHMKALSEELKSRLVDSYSQQRKWSMPLILLLLLAFILNQEKQWVDPSLALLIYLIMALGFVVFTFLASSKRLKGGGFPSTYIQAHQMSFVIKLIGAIVFFVLIFLGSPGI